MYSSTPTLFILISLVSSHNNKKLKYTCIPMSYAAARSIYTGQLSLSLYPLYFKKIKRVFFFLLWIIKESNGSNPLFHPLYSWRIHHQSTKHSRENHKGKISVKAFVSFKIKKKPSTRNKILNRFKWTKKEGRTVARGDAIVLLVFLFFL
jgi:hypothetical protein